MARHLGEEKVFFLGHSHGGFVGEIAVPVLVVVGAYDFICGEKWARQLHDGIPGSELVVLADAGHFGHLEEPKQFFGSVLRFATAH